MTAAPVISLPVAVVMARRTVAGKAWRVPSWHVAGVLAGEGVADATVRGTRIHADENEEHFLWGGFRLELYRDATASYWANLTGTSPSLFVLCDEQESGELLPKMVTADQEEASAGVEVNEKVFSVPIPPEVYQHIEAVVVAHHVPEEKKRRKRTNWSESQGS